MIEASAAISTLASAIAPPPPIVEAQVRAPVADQPTVSAERAAPLTSLRYFRFNLKYDAADKRLYVVFKNPVSGDVVEQLPNSSRGAVSSRPTQTTTERSDQPAPSTGGSAPTTKSAAPPAPGPSAAPSAPGAGAAAAAASSGGSEVSRGSAVDSRI